MQVNGKESSLYIGNANQSDFSHKIYAFRKQVEIRNQWLKQRFDEVLPALMRRENIDLWIVCAREYNEDPVMMSLLPASMCSARRTTILVFHQQEDGSVKAMSLSRPGTGIDHLYQGVWVNPKGQNWDDSTNLMGVENKKEQTPPETQWECLARIVRDANPEKIGLNISHDFAFGDGLTKTLHDEMIAHWDEDYIGRIVSAETLCIGWLEYRTDAEIAAYTGIVQIAHAIIAEAYSSRVILPGVTTNDDVKYFMIQKVIDLGLSHWFDFEVSINREKVGRIDQETIILPGDILHCDVGLVYLGLCTDTQQNAYILKLDETEVPAGIAAVQEKLKQLQDITISHFTEGRSGNEILKRSLEKAISKGLKPSIYTHPIGYHGHGAGPTIGLWDMQSGVPGKGDIPLNNRTFHALELNVTASIPEWDGQEIMLGAETDILFKDGKVYYIAGRQESFYLVK